MVVRQIAELSERPRDLFCRRLVKRAVDVVVVIVDEQQSASLDELPRIASLGVGEPDGQMAGHIKQRETQHPRIAERYGYTGRRDGILRVFGDRVDEVRRHDRRTVPVTGLVLPGSKDEVGGHGTPPLQPQRESVSRDTGVPASTRRARASACVASLLLPLRIAFAASLRAAANAGAVVSASIRNTRSESVAARVSRSMRSMMPVKRLAKCCVAESGAGSARRVLGVPLSF